MKELFKLRKDKKETLSKAQSIVENAEKENRDMTAEEQTQYNEYLASVDSMNKRIERMEKLEEQVKTLPADKTEGLEISGEGKISGGEPALLKDQKHGFKSMGEFAKAVIDAGNPNIKQLDERLKISASVSGMSMTGTDGGYACPPAYSQVIYDGVQAQSESLLSMTDNYTVEQGNDSLTFPAVDESSRADGSRWGGVQGYWLAEGDKITSSKAKLRQVKVEPKELGILVYVTDKLLNNTRALDQFITRAAIDEISFKVGDAIVSGNGDGKPTGILSSGALIEVDRETGQTEGTLISTNITKMWSRMPVRSRANSAWFINQELENYLDSLNVVLTDVGGTTTVGGFSSMIYNAEKNTLKGRPIIPLEYCSAPGTAGDIILADMKSYLVGLRGAVNSAMSIHLRFDYRESAFRFVFEIDGKTWVSSAVTPKNGTATVSPFITLASDDPSA